MELLITIIAAALALIIYFHMKWNYSYWKRRSIPHQAEFFWGNVLDQMNKGLTFGSLFTKFYNEAKAKGHKHLGIYVFSKPLYIPIHLDIVKHILQKDFNHFINHGFYVNEELDPLTGNLFSLENDRWRKLRTKLTPTLTPGKVKMMFQTLVDCTLGLEEILNHHSSKKDPADIKDIVSRYTTDIIGSCGFGVDCNSLRNPNSEFRHFGRKIYEPDMYTRLRDILFFVVSHKILRFLKIKHTPDDVENFFMTMVKETVQYRENNNVYRKDFMHLLLQLKNRGQVTEDENVTKENIPQENKDQSLSMNEIAAQCFVFFIAGYETSANTMSFALLELAMNQDIQEKLRKNIMDVLEKNNNQLTYDAVMEMTYLDQVVHETMRRHPPVPGLPRICNKEYKIPGTDGVLEAGTLIHIPIQAIQSDPEYYPNPEKFDPDRFSEENKSKRPPYSFLVFGEGPRVCIGARFGLMQIKMGLISVLKNFKVTLHEKTITPIEYENKTFVNTVKGGVWLNVCKIE